MSRQMKFLSSMPELQGVTSRTEGYHTYPLHFHANLEILYTRKGTQTLLFQGQTYRMNPGDLMVIFPFQAHEFIVPGEGYGQLICCHPIFFSVFTHSLLTMVPEAPILSADRVPERICTLLDLIMDTPEGPHRKETLNSLFCALFWEILDILPLVSLGGKWNADIERLMIACMELYRDPELSLEMISGICGISTRSISRFFSERMGVSFPRFISMLRLHDALEQMTRGTVITDAALSSGFGSVCSFNRVFREVFGTSPRLYIQKDLADSDCRMAESK